jgi:hypothetical protein
MDGEQAIINYEKDQLHNIAENVAKMNKILGAN